MKKRKLLLILLSPIFILGLVKCDNSNDEGIIASWVQSGPNGTTIARVITQRENCPEIRLNGVDVQMQVRHSPDDDFPVLVCEIIIPQGTITASIGGRTLKLPVENPKRLVVIADTGCRLETGDVPQSCNDPQAWPFELIAKTAASFNPDLVVHVGNYFYREDPVLRVTQDVRGPHSVIITRPGTQTFSPLRISFFVQRPGLLHGVTTKSAAGEARAGSLSLTQTRHLRTARNLPLLML